MNERTPSLRRAALTALLLAVVPAAALAAVTLLYFTATPAGQAVRLDWATASEVDMVGFYVQRADESLADYERISPLIPAEGGVIGASYAHVDENVQPGVTYYYRLEALDIYGVGELFGPISATLPLPPTATPTPTPLLSTATPTPRPLAIQFWADHDTVARGQCTTLRWRVENAQAVYFQGQGVPGSGDQQVCPAQTTVYGLRVVGDRGEERRELTVAVSGVAPTGTPAPTNTPPPTLTPAPTATRPAGATPAAISPLATPLPSPRPSHAPTPAPSTPGEPAASPTLPLIVIPFAPSPQPAQSAGQPPTPRPPSGDGERSPSRLSVTLPLLAGAALLGLALLVILLLWRRRRRS